MSEFAHVNAKATKILATHCCVCSTPLVDAKSIQAGIGPVCARKYLKNRDVETTPEEWGRAIDLLAGAKLVPDDVKGKALKRRDDARHVCNLLVYWASTNYSDKSYVFECSQIIRMLGYVKLADKLEQDRTSAWLEQDEEFIYIHSRYEPDFPRVLRKHTWNAKWMPKPDKCWRVPLAHMSGALFALAMVYGYMDQDDQMIRDFEVLLKGHGVIRMSGDVSEYRKNAETARQSVMPKKKEAPKRIELVYSHGRVGAVTPFNREYLARVKQVLSRKWDTVSHPRMWSVSEPRKDALVQAIKDSYPGYEIVDSREA